MKRLPSPSSPAETFHLDVQATDAPAEVRPVDLVWFCVKTYDLDVAARQAAPMVGPETMILPIQNGADAAERIAAVIGAGHVLGGVALGGATLTAPGMVEQKTARVPLRFGELDGRLSARAERLHQTLIRAGIEAVLSENIVREIWEKLIFASFSQALTALTRLPLGPLLACPETAELARGIIAEAVAVGRAQGVAFPDDAAEHHFEYGRRYAVADPTARASMSFDLIAGRRLELEAINGAIVRLGRASGIPTPLNGAMYAALKPFAAGAVATPPLPRAGEGAGG